MSETRLPLKHPTGFFAAGAEMENALGLLSDGAFKIFVYVCLHADRRTAQLRFRMAELAQATGHSTRSLTSIWRRFAKLRSVWFTGRRINMSSDESKSETSSGHMKNNWQSL